MLSVVAGLSLMLSPQMGSMPREPLYQAIAALDEKAFRLAVLREGASLTAIRKDEEEPPLFYALRWRTMFDLLRRLGEPIAGVDAQGRTLLHNLASDAWVVRHNVPIEPVPAPIFDSRIVQMAFTVRGRIGKSLQSIS